MIPDAPDTTLEDWAETVQKISEYLKENPSGDLRCVLTRKDNLIKLPGFIFDEAVGPCDGYVERAMSSDFDLNFYQPDRRLIEGDYLGRLFRYYDEDWHFLGYDPNHRDLIEHQTALRLKHIVSIGANNIYFVNQLSEFERFIDSNFISDFIKDEFSETLETVLEI